MKVEARRKRGRPPKERPRRAQTSVRLSADTATALDQIAANRGWTRAAAAYAAIRLGLDAIERGADPVAALLEGPPS